MAAAACPFCADSEAVLANRHPRGGVRGVIPNRQSY